MICNEAGPRAPGQPKRCTGKPVAESFLLIVSFYYRGVVSARDLGTNGAKTGTRMKKLSKVCEKALQ